MLLATVKCDLGAIALEDAFEAVPGMTVEAVRITAHSTGWTMPCIWVSHGDFEAVDQALEASTSVDTIVGGTEFGSEKFYMVRWSETVETRVNNCIDEAGVILKARATGPDGWKLEFCFIDRDQFDSLRERFFECGHSFTLLELTEPGHPHASFGEVTSRQREALVAAREAGYFEVPREVTASELATELDVSQQAISELLRRGTAKLVNEMVVTKGETIR